MVDLRFASFVGLSLKQKYPVRYSIYRVDISNIEYRFMANLALGVSRAGYCTFLRRNVPSPKVPRHLVNRKMSVKSCCTAHMAEVQQLLPCFVCVKARHVCVKSCCTAHVAEVQQLLPCFVCVKASHTIIIFYSLRPMTKNDMTPSLLVEDKGDPPRPTSS